MTETTSTIVIGSRGSKLALAQAELVRTMLLQPPGREEGLDVRVEVISTSGDRTGRELSAIGGEGVFTAEIEEALLAEHIDLAVHSLKDLPTIVHKDLALMATPSRADVRDVLITREPATDPTAGEVPSLLDLPEAASLATGSPRRRAQLLALRPDLRFVDIRGNVDTRIARLREGKFDGIVLAAAGLQRLSRLEEISIYLDTTQVLPAPGQGAIGLQMRRDEGRVDLVSLVQGLNHASTWSSVTAERSFLRALGGGCRAPIAAWGRVISDELHVDGVVAQTDGSQLSHVSITGDPDDAETLGTSLAREIQDMGVSLPRPETSS